MAESAPLPIGAPLGSSTPGFGTDGIRGRVGTVLTPALALQVGYWAGQVLGPAGPILLGMDSRSSGAMVVASLTAGLTAAGREVWSIGLCPTPAIPYLIRRCGAAGGLMVSASHNPPEDNGIKVFGACGAKLDRARQDAIEAGLRGDRPGAVIRPALTGCGAAHQRHDLLAAYRDFLAASLGGVGLEGARIVLDLCWGSATACGAELFRDLGAEVTVLHGDPDGTRINVGCGSTHLDPLRQAVLERGASAGFAFDGDADRMLAVDGRGRVVDGDQILHLWGSALRREPGALPESRLVTTLMTNLAFERAWQQAGGLMERTAVGDQHVHAAMEATGAGLGGEQSGHILSAAHGMSGDGLLTALQVLRHLDGFGCDLAGWMDQSFQPYPQRLINVRVEDADRRRQWRSSTALRQAVEAAEQALGAEGRVLVRPSGTEPLLRIMVEAARRADVAHWSGHLAQIAGLELGGPRPEAVQAPA
ncbi:phosphoglucosamine mutase [Synechococcus sp. RSCCF101]|uniref:phosphoglucosamine mutase n=1 Tax=Synechococcus sp. RSCCF101 TaxID=2511069 RepID=UPI001244ABCD|nr:phosphoglucosamine mutase [Synechococcus sp. RSCCF101]QEY32256.1 phosphoglucosamine mutase [Synechococcus sp. RSCCF101]